MLTQFQARNHKDLMLQNRSIKSVSRSKHMFGSISGASSIMLTQFQARYHKDLMLPNRSIKSLSSSKTMFGSISGSISDYAYTVSSAVS